MLIIKNAQVFNTHFRTFRKADVLIEDGKFKWISETPIEKNGAKIIDATGKYMIPGLIDIHMHIESSMTTANRFSEAVLPFGVTTIVADPHEMANVFGLSGIQAFIDTQTTLDIFCGIPSSVPSTNPDLETTGGQISETDVKELIKDNRVICFGEIMNYKELIDENLTKTQKMIAAFKALRPLAPVEGHCPKIYGEELAQFIAAGVDSDHTHQTRETIIEKISNGMFIEMQRKSINKETIGTLKEYNLFNCFAIITDDVMPDDLANGHLNSNLLKAVSCGLSVEEAIYCSTYTGAQRMNLFDRGIIAPGKIADFVLLNDLLTWAIESVYKNGKEVVNMAKGIIVKEAEQQFPEFFYQTINCVQFTATDFELLAPLDKVIAGKVSARIINKVFNSTFTEELIEKFAVKEGKVQYQETTALLAVVERYGNNNPLQYGLLRGGINKDGAIASSWAHDHHNILVHGIGARDMMLAANRVRELQGGIVVVENGEIIAECPLPIGGIISAVPISELSEQVKTVRAAMQKLGYFNQDEIMSFATLSLLVSPQLKISDKGLIDVKTQEILSLFI